eukprot:gene10513-biopygen3374
MNGRVIQPQRQAQRGAAGHPEIHRRGKQQVGAGIGNSGWNNGDSVSVVAVVSPTKMGYIRTNQKEEVYPFQGVRLQAVLCPFRRAAREVEGAAREVEGAGSAALEPSAIIRRQFPSRQ